MSYQQQRSLSTIVSGGIIVVIYFWVALGKMEAVHPDTESLLRFWAASILILVPVSVAAEIVTAIVSAIIYRITAGEDPPMIEDERDHLIELKASQVSQLFFVVVFLGSMVPIVFGMSVTIMFLILVGGGFLAHVAGEVGRILMYR